MAAATHISVEQNRGVDLVYPIHSSGFRGAADLDVDNVVRGAFSRLFGGRDLRGARQSPPRLRSDRTALTRSATFLLQSAFHVDTMNPVPGNRGKHESVTRGLRGGSSSSDKREERPHPTSPWRGPTHWTTRSARLWCWFRKRTIQTEHSVESNLQGLPLLILSPLPQVGPGCILREVTSGLAPRSPPNGRPCEGVPSHRWSRWEIGR